MGRVQLPQAPNFNSQGLSAPIIAATAINAKRAKGLLGFFEKLLQYAPDPGLYISTRGMAVNLPLESDSTIETRTFNQKLTANLKRPPILQKLLAEAEKNPSLFFGDCIETLSKETLNSFTTLLKTPSTNKAAISLAHNWFSNQGVDLSSLTAYLNATTPEAKNQTAADLILSLNLDASTLEKIKNGDKKAFTDLNLQFTPKTSPLLKAFIQTSLANDTVIKAFNQIETALLEEKPLAGIDNALRAKLLRNLTDKTIQKARISNSLEIPEHIQKRLEITNTSFHTIQSFDLTQLERVFGDQNTPRSFSFNFKEFVEGFYQGGTNRDQAFNNFCNAFLILEDSKIEYLEQEDNDGATHIATQQALMMEILLDPRILDPSGALTKEINKYLKLESTQQTIAQLVPALTTYTSNFTDSLYIDFIEDWNEKNPDEEIDLTDENRKTVNDLIEANDRRIRNLAVPIIDSINDHFGVEKLNLNPLAEKLKKITQAPEENLLPINLEIKKLIARNPDIYHLISSDNKSLQYYGLFQFDQKISTIPNSYTQEKLREEIAKLLNVPEDGEITINPGIQTVNFYKNRQVDALPHEQFISIINSIDTDPGFSGSKAVLDHKIYILNPSDNLGISTEGAQRLSIREALNSPTFEVQTQAIRALAHHLINEPEGQELDAEIQPRSDRYHQETGSLAMDWDFCKTMSFNNQYPHAEADFSFDRIEEIVTLADQNTKFKSAQSSIENYAKEFAAQSLGTLSQLVIRSPISTSPQIQKERITEINKFERNATSQVDNFIHNNYPNEIDFANFIKGLLKYFIDGLKKVGMN